MGLHQPVRDKTLTVAWRQEVEGFLWRLVPDGEGGLIGEVRDPAARRASFVRFLVASGAIAWRGVRAPGGWWSGIECVMPGAVLLHGFASPELPGHRGLTALDLRTGAVLWRDDELIFVAAVDRVVYGLRGRPEQGELVGWNVVTGDAVPVGPADEDRVRELVARWQGSPGPAVLLPEPVEDGTEEYEAADFLLEGAPVVKGGLEMLKTAGVTVTVHHVQGAPADGGRSVFTRILTVIGPGMTDVVFREILDENLPVPIPEAFLVVDRTLLYVKQRRTLCAVHLPGAGSSG